MKLRTVKLPHFNNAAEIASTEIRLPEKVIISMSQHGGVPCTPLVNVGDTVKTGQLIGISDAVISAPVHSSVTGKVTEITEIINVFGKRNKAVVIETDLRQTLHEDIKPPVIDTREDFIKAVKDSGSVGLGGAGFPTYVKLNCPEDSGVDTLVVNGAECEPYITSDYRAFMEDGEKIAAGIRIILEKLGLKRAVIGIEADKPQAIKKMRSLTEKDDNISVASLKSLYPQGAEKVLIYNTTGRVVEAGKLPMAAGCIVINCSTVAFIYDYIKTGIPLIKRRITVDGPIVNKPANLIVPVGIRIKDILEAANVRKQPDRVLMGGPMMGTCIYDENTPVSKTNNAVLLFADTKPSATTACIRCGRCVNACSMGLMPTELEHAYDAKDSELLEKLNINLCMNCGACTFVCPAKRNISEKNQLAKLFVRQSKEAKLKG
ncbi:MAG: electron transport complex subunit RsxC [Ruminiclostridium sp.]|nr:electron transport complex subunit RsxC [Ruminiclostridium sp.]